ncbi:heat shock protein HslJ [Serratia entomophila]|uniref:heat shock protein HslJ n=1 Tax=Serratia entomophila TaxID=42906 RepID=UPI00217AB1D7|nr:heat shock protein HslJ [Serratia entomophila]CAI0786272.1 Heat shock protein hslJ [Serratia entomophila]CAI0787769.1 Heat shock protein hslJ [Serratia entomophila]CAI0792767.1 Heat shock protein hslJ [Serratia entomophila]CAI1606260.1 Heat shock protein hslJ [Serratia entomophila]CAI1622540.1 Heat shock protein hslJ [Serratia entomophila]
MKNYAPLALAAMLLAGCGMNQPDNAVSESDLLHHNYVLHSVDGVPIEPGLGNAPNLEFGEKMHVSGAMCNRFFGQGQLANGVLRVQNLASTRMLCADAQRNHWDQVIGQVLENGAKLTLSAQRLTLSGGDHTLVYTLRDWVQ